MNQVKLLSTTAILAALIWMTADQLQVVTVGLDVALRFEAREPDSGMVIRPLDSSAPPFKVVVSGPRRAVAAVQEAQNLAMTLHVKERPTAMEDRIEDLAGLLREEGGPLRNLLILSVDPPEALVSVDRWVDQEVSVEIRKPLNLAYTELPKLERDKVRVRMWESQLQALRGRGSLPVIMIDVEAELSRNRRGERVEVRVPVNAAALFGREATSEPDRVKVEATLAPEQLARKKLDAVAIRPCLGFEYLGRRMEVVLADGATIVTRRIEVEGTADAIAAIDAVLSESRIYGVINLREEDIKNRIGQELSIVPDIILPEGLKLVRPPDPVRLTIVTVDEE
ncbi:MAG: hypothetical protein FLDDKLPJ_00008 [Phycisphaerae bacterium]|nr:hypothetical protein [Phycisphaerae bacterium]